MSERSATPDLVDHVVVAASAAASRCSSRRRIWRISEMAKVVRLVFYRGRDHALADLDLTE